MNKTVTTVALLFSALASAAVQAQEFDARNHLTGDWGGARARLAERGVELRLNYAGEYARNFSGGARETSAYADQLFLAGTFDLERLWSWSGATFRIEIANRNGDLLNNEAGMPTLLQVQEIFGRGSVTRLAQFSLQQDLLDGRLALKAGRLYANADFFSFSCNFQNLSFCGGLPGYITNGWFTDPISQYGAVVVFKPIDAWRFKLGGYDVNPQNLAHDQGLRLKTRGESAGTLMLAEVEYRPDFGGGLDGNYRVGGWRNSASYRDVVTVTGLPGGLSDDPARLLGSETGTYVTGEQQLWRDAAGGGLRLFGNWVQADEDTNRVDQMLSLGLWWQAPFAARPHDRIGLALGRTRVNQRLGDAQRRYNAALPAGSSERIAVQEYEYPMELNYHLAVTPALSLMPGVQYIRHANGVDGENALVAGMRVSLSF